MSNTLIVLLPLLALLLAAVSIAALWYWWTSGQEDLGESQTENDPSSYPYQDLQRDEPTVGDLLGKVTTSAQSLLAHVTKTASAPAPGYVSSQGAAPFSDGEMVEVMRVFRDLADGRLVVEVGGRRYRNTAEITDPQVKRRFVGNAQALAQFIQDEPSLSNQVNWSTPPVEVAKPPAPPMQPAPLPTKTAKPEAQGQQPEGPKTIADEIEELIQFRLLSMPSLSSHSIHIRPGLGGGIRVEVDGVYHDGISDVTDAEILSFLQSVIREWEARS
jgi:hypothetical protein